MSNKRDNAGNTAAMRRVSREHHYPITRGICLFFGLFALLNVVVCLKGGVASNNQNMWWLDLTSLSFVYNGSSFHFGFVVEGLAAIAMILWAAAPHCAAPRRAITCVLTGLLAVFALLNAVTYWKTIVAGTLYWALPVSLSAVIFLIFAWVTFRIATARAFRRGGMLGYVAVVIVALVAALLFPLLQITFFGTTDYRRDASAAVVFGARVYEDGDLSYALRERMDTAIELYEQEFVPVIIVSGGVEEGGVDEAQAMYDYAVEKGVPTSALLIDRYGDTTEASVNNTISLMDQYGFTTMIATSSYYHMPRIKMLFNLQNIDVLTVPTIGDIAGNGTLASVWREIPAWWFYWFKGAFGS